MNNDCRPLIAYDGGTVWASNSVTSTPSLYSNQKTTENILL